MFRIIRGGSDYGNLNFEVFLVMCCFLESCKTSDFATYQLLPLIPVAFDSLAFLKAISELDSTRPLVPLFSEYIPWSPRFPIPLQLYDLRGYPITLERLAPKMTIQRPNSTYLLPSITPRLMPPVSIPPSSSKISWLWTNHSHEQKLSNKLPINGRHPTNQPREWK